MNMLYNYVKNIIQIFAKRNNVSFTETEFQKETEPQNVFVVSVLLLTHMHQFVEIMEELTRHLVN